MASRAPLMVADVRSTRNYLSELKRVALEKEIGEDATLATQS